MLLHIQLLRLHLIVIIIIIIVGMNIRCATNAFLFGGGIGGFGGAGGSCCCGGAGCCGGMGGSAICVANYGGGSYGSGSCCAAGGNCGGGCGSGGGCAGCSPAAGGCGGGRCCAEGCSGGNGGCSAGNCGGGCCAGGCSAAAGGCGGCSPNSGCTRECRECSSSVVANADAGGGGGYAPQEPNAIAQEMEDEQSRYIIVSPIDQHQQPQQPINAPGNNVPQINVQSTADENCGGVAQQPVEQMPAPIPYPSMPEAMPMPTTPQEYPATPMSSSPAEYMQPMQQPNGAIGYYHRAAAVATKKSSPQSFAESLPNNGGEEDGTATNAGVCNSAELRQLMDTQMVDGDANESKRRIHSTANRRTTMTTTSANNDLKLTRRRSSSNPSTDAATARSGGAATGATTTDSSSSNDKNGRGIDVICAPGVFSYRISTDLYCEHTKRNTTCFAFLQQPLLLYYVQ